jgi:hypothetical protein
MLCVVDLMKILPMILGLQAAGVQIRSGKKLTHKYQKVTGG